MLNADPVSVYVDVANLNEEDTKDVGPHTTKREAERNRYCVFIDKNGLQDAFIGASNTFKIDLVQFLTGSHSIFYFPFN